MQIRKALVPLDPSPLSQQTIERLIALKEKIFVPLTLLHVIDFDLLSCQGFAERTYAEFEERVRREARELIEGQQALFRSAGIETEILLVEGEVRKSICKLADSGKYDLLVVGKSPDAELRKFLFGQIGNYLMHHVSCPVLAL